MIIFTNLIFASHHQNGICEANKSRNLGVVKAVCEGSLMSGRHFSKKRDSSRCSKLNNTTIGQFVKRLWTDCSSVNSARSKRSKLSASERNIKPPWKFLVVWFILRPNKRHVWPAASFHQFYLFICILHFQCGTLKLS